MEFCRYLMSLFESLNGIFATKEKKKYLNQNKSVECGDDQRRGCWLLQHGRCPQLIQVDDNKEIFEAKVSS